MTTRSSRTPTRQPAIYVAARVETFWQPGYEIALAHVVSMFPGRQLLEARVLFSSTAHWKANWLKTLARVGGLVLIVAEDGLAGRGCAKEIMDARLRGLPCWLATPEGIFSEWALNEVEPRLYAAVIDSDERSECGT